MASNDIVSAILHYKRNIDKISAPPERALKYEDRLLHCIHKLYKLPVNVNHLQETGVGRTVNSLRKIEGEKGLGEAAKALVAKWKNMVMLEDEAERKQKEGPSEEDLKRIKLIREAEKAELKKTENNSKAIENHKNDEEEKTKSLDDNASKKRKHESSDGGKSHKHRKTHEENKRSNHEISSKSAEKAHSSSSSHKSHESSSKNSISSKSKSSSSSSKHKSSSSCDKSESKKHHKKVENDGFDSQSGASFADALGPMVVKKSPKKSKNQLSAISSPTASDGSSNHSSSSYRTPKKESNDINGLFPKPELDPLEPEDIMPTLPVTTPYYKPSPINNLLICDSSKKRIQSEEDALTTIMSNKNQRTKVYSGVKGGLTYVPTLYEFCCRVLQQHIDALEYTGGIPYSLLKPVLDNATPAQLLQFQHYNPYIIEDTDHLWKFHVSKEFANKKRQEYESWRDMYLRCVDEREEKYKAVTANIQKSIEKSTPVRKTILAYVDVAKPPRNILRKQIKNGITKPESSRLMGKDDPSSVKIPASKIPASKEPAIFKIKPKVAPLMQKTLKSIKMTRFKR